MATTTTTTIIISLIYASAAAIASSSSPTTYLIGLGSRDITGPAADVNMMGYANPTQTAAGIHIRLHARTFIVAEAETNSDGKGNRVVFVNLDACMASQAVTNKVLERLKDRSLFSLQSFLYIYEFR